ncbi:nuclear transport factor 2 family protein [Kitasatospora sp. NPDC056651]|uniref:nuclear transport factor 2 family protein n=1 Tax=Kitasatospora sp. NPDC056651 TaxID=3345892 RepID=UPI00369DA74D
MSITLRHAELHVEVQDFYARQVRLQNEGRAEEWAATFTEDARLAHEPEDVVVHRVGKGVFTGRAELAATMRRLHEKLTEARIRQRHLYTMLTVEPRHDATIGTSYYSLVFRIKPGEKPAPEVSCPTTDVLVRGDDGKLRVRSRTITHDERPWDQPC